MVRQWIAGVLKDSIDSLRKDETNDIDNFAALMWHLLTGKR